MANVPPPPAKKSRKGPPPAADITVGKPRKGAPPTGALTVGNLTKAQPGSLKPLNFKVPAAFHRDFKVFASQQGISMLTLLQEGFDAVRERRGYK